MDIIDSEGRLLGRVNVIDAMVVLVVLAIGVAGAAVVAPGSTGQNNTNGTDNETGTGTGVIKTESLVVRFNTQPEDVASLIQPGDTLNATRVQTESIRVADVYRTPVRDGRADVVALLVVNRSNASDGFRAGGTYDFVASDYRMNGSVRAVGGNRSALPTATTNVTVETSVSPAVARAIEDGDRYRVADETVARIEEATVIPTRNGQDRVRMLLSLQTLRTDETIQFGGQPVRYDRQLTFRTSRYAVTGPVTEIGTSSIELERTETAVRLETTVPTATAQAITAGDSYTLGGRTLATVETVSVYPTGNPGRKRVQVGVTLQTTTDGDRTQFLDQPVATGSSLTLRMDEYTLDGTIIEQGTVEPLGTPERVNVTVRIENVSPTVARSIPVGAVERSRGQVYARITGKTVRPATVVLQTDSGRIYQRQHPIQKTVTLAVELTTRRTESGLSFHGRQIQNGRSVTLNLGSTTVSGAVFGLPSR